MKAHDWWGREIEIVTIPILKYIEEKALFISQQLIEKDLIENNEKVIDKVVDILLENL